MGANRRGVDLGPSAIRYAGLLEKLGSLGYNVKDKGDITPFYMPDTNPKMKNLEAIKDANAKLYAQAKNGLSKDVFLVTVGGDHSISCASVAAVMNCFGSIGIIWVDAHGDFNNEDSSITGNIHGMSLSAICGFGPDEIMEFDGRKNFVNPQNVVLVGGRDFDSREITRLKRSGVTVFSISDIDRLGISEVMQKSVDIASKNVNGIHLSFDMDAVTPSDAPGVSTPVHSGLTTREAFLLAEIASESGRIISLDVVEINTILDTGNKTALLASEIVLSVLGKRVF